MRRSKRRTAGGSEDVVAAVVPAADRPSVEELREFARERLARYKVPRDIVFVDDLPRSMLGKVVRKQVRDLIG